MSSKLPHPPEFDSPTDAPNADAMDKITDRYDVNLSGRPPNRDAMDQIIGLDDLVISNVHSLCVETNQEDTEPNAEENLCVETDSSPPQNQHQMPKTGLHVETNAVLD